jgi:hypothetical protein
MEKVKKKGILELGGPYLERLEVCLFLGKSQILLKVHLVWNERSTSSVLKYKNYFWSSKLSTTIRIYKYQMKN